MTGSCSSSLLLLAVGAAAQSSGISDQATNLALLTGSRTAHASRELAPPSADGVTGVSQWTAVHEAILPLAAAVAATAAQPLMKCLKEKSNALVVSYLSNLVEIRSTWF